MPAKQRPARQAHLLREARRYLPGGSFGNVGKDIVISRGRGGRVWDADGNEYVDYLLGSGPMIVGHAHPEVVAAVRDQLELGTTYFAINEPAIRLAEEIVRAVPCAQKVRFSSSGSEATLYAMRVARAYRKRDKILKFEGGFHGMNDYSLMSLAPTKLVDFPQAVADSAGMPDSVRREVLVAPFNDVEKASEIIRRNHDDLAGVIVEPLQRVIPPLPGFLEELREVTLRYEIPLIFDEIVTGFRLSYGGAQEYYGVTPDICTLGKAVAGGFPLTAVAGREDMMSHFDATAAETGDFLPQVGTLSGNPVAAVAGLATLEILRRDGTYADLFATGNRIRQALQQILDQAEVQARVVGDAPLFDVFFTDAEITDYRSTLRADKAMYRQLDQLLLERGVFKGDSKYYVSTAHTEKDVALTIEALAAAIDELRG